MLDSAEAELVEEVVLLAVLLPLGVEVVRVLPEEPVADPAACYVRMGFLARALGTCVLLPDAPAEPLFNTLDARTSSAERTLL